MAFLFYKSQKPNFHEELTVLNLWVCGCFKYIWISVLPFKLHNLFFCFLRWDFTGLWSQLYFLVGLETKLSPETGSFSFVFASEVTEIKN